MKLRALGLLVGVVLGGCSNLPVTIAPSNIPLTRTKYTVIGPCEGDSMGVSIIGIPVAGVRHAAEARDRAIQAGGGDALGELPCIASIHSGDGNDAQGCVNETLDRREVYATRPIVRHRPCSLAQREDERGEEACSRRNVEEA